MATNEGDSIRKIQKNSGDNELNRETNEMTDFTSDADEITEISDEMLSKYHIAFTHNDESTMKSMIMEDPALLFYGLDLMAMTEEDEQDTIIDPELQKGLDEISQRIQQKFEMDQEKRMLEDLINSGLIQYIKKSGQKLSEFCTELSITRITIDKLSNRWVEASTIPTTLISRIAEALGTSQRTIQAYFQQPPLLPVAMFKASNHPTTVRSLETFSVIIQNDPNMKPDDKDFWLNAK